VIHKVTEAIEKVEGIVSSCYIVHDRRPVDRRRARREARHECRV